MAPIPRLVRLTDPAEGEHFTGYYDLNPWSADGKRLLYLEVRDPAVSRLVPDGSQFARVMVMDGASGARQCIGTTNAWNWQLGARQQWLGGNIPTFNLDATQTMHAFWRFPSVRSLAAVAINFHRLQACRPGYGYGPILSAADYVQPGDDGLELRTNIGVLEQSEMLVSLRQLRELLPREEIVSGVAHWINHVQPNPSGTRLAFIHRWRGGPERRHRLYTVGIGGSDLRMIVDGWISHYDWLDDLTIIGFVQAVDGVALAKIDDRCYYDPMPIGWRPDGHCSMSPGGCLVLLDRPSPDKDGKTVLYVKWLRDLRKDDTELARLEMLPGLTGPIRCDLHATWHPDGRSITFNSAHEGTRQIYSLDLPEEIREELAGEVEED